jgi:PIN domain nuclease of toxin-antitoxin system
MRLVLDTHTFIWWDSNPSRLSAVALAALRDPSNAVWLSGPISQLTLRLHRAIMLSGSLTPGGLTEATYKQLALEGLPSIHKNPFDPLLIAQTFVEGWNWCRRMASSFGIPSGCCGSRSQEVPGSAAFLFRPAISIWSDTRDD